MDKNKIINKLFKEINTGKVTLKSYYVLLMFEEDKPFILPFEKKKK